ncbi:MAG: UvrD-helicase domain-containing protein [Acidobacteriota bacterium]
MTLDEEQRRRAREDTNHSFMVEASAGTGKTRILIQRILHCVLESGPDGEPVRLSRICAITFTEKAAGEMKIRLRQELEREGAGGGEKGDRARQALIDLEGAAISTIHAFAVSLLKERPIEAGLDPQFRALDEIQGELLFREVWEAWLQRAIEERKTPLESALRAGLRLDALRSAARTIRQHAHEIRILTLPSPPTEEEARQSLAELLDRGASYAGLVLNDDDKLVPSLHTALAWLSDPAGAATPRKPGNSGTARNWDGGRETLDAVKEFVRNVVDFRPWYLKLPIRRVLDALLRLIIGEFLPEWERRKRTDGLVDFDDMLWHARDLLRCSRAAREDLRKHYALLLVDEFQDTDAVQWEMIRLLAAGAEEGDGQEGLTPPGRLFIVGDPKQSIYRFRGADIETYLNVADPECMVKRGLERLELTTNFRSVPAILSFVDEAFHGIMKKAADTPFQPDYLPFGGRGDRVGRPETAGFCLLGDRQEDGSFAGSGPDFVTVEATRITGLIASMRNNADWGVESKNDRDKTWRAPSFGDIAILLPVLTRADELEDCLRKAGIPYVLEGGKFYYARSEVASAITVLRAIANPNDAIALYATLRSIFFGVSDEDLLRAKAEALPLDYRVEVPSDCALARPYRILRDLHQHRHERTASETLENLLQQTGAREVLAVRGIQSLANLNKLVRTLRSLQQDATFSEVVETVAGMEEEGIAESESRVMEEHSDAVRILSIHRAKGLDFPIVIVAGLGIHRKVRYAEYLADPHGSKTFGLSLGSKESGLQTIGWEDLTESEKAKEEAELIRLLYVSLTRARDHLILCTHAKGKWIPDGERWAANFAGTRLEPLAAFLQELPKRENSPVRFIDANTLPPAPAPSSVAEEVPERDLPATLAAQYDELRRLLAETPHAHDLQVPSSEAGQEEGKETDLDFARDRAARIGTAFHQVMETIDLDAEDGTEDLAREAGSRQRLDGAGIESVAEMLSRSLKSPIMERVRRARVTGGRVLRELPYIRPLDGDGAAIEEGKIDLLFEEGGNWVLIDYKTDRLPGDMPDKALYFQDKYGGQVSAYAAALEALGIRLKSAYLLLARTGEAIEVTC